MTRLLLTLAGILTFAGLSAQCSVIEVPLVQRAGASSVIVEGKVTSQYSYWNNAHNMIYTSNVVELYKVFKGTVNTASIEIVTEGGTVGLDRITVEPSLEMAIGDVGVFTCTGVQRAVNIPATILTFPRFEAYASLQGFVKYDIETDVASDHFRSYSNLETEIYDVVCPTRNYTTVQSLDPMNPPSPLHNGPPPSVQTITNFSPTTTTAGTGSTITITGSSFGAVQGSGTVRFLNADDGGATRILPLASQYVSWSSTQIVVEVPQNAGTGTIQVVQGSTFTSAQTLTISYAHLNVDFDPGTGTEAYGPDHINDNGSGGYTWSMNTAFDADVAMRASFMRAFDTWRCGTNVNWTIGATTAINDAVSDGTNIICEDVAAPLSAGVLGVCYSYWSGCASGPTIIWYVNELDIIFDDGSNISPLTWEYGPATPSGSEYDFETVAVHELGHGHQLGHVISNGAIMHYAISNGTSNRALGANDLAGGQFVQAKSVVANVCGPGAMTNFTCAAAPVAAFIGSPTTVCPGSSVAFTDQSTNTPTSWSWNFGGGTPSSSTAQNPTITYNTPGTYSVSLTATNASGSDNETVVGYITVTSAVSVTPLSQTNVACNAGTDGAASVSVSGGTPSYSFNWTPGNPTGDGTSSVTGLGAGTYTCTVSDANGCQGTRTFTITAPTAINVSPLSQTNVVCNLGSNGAASVSVSGGTPSYSFNWTPGNPTGDGTSSVTNLSAGTYTCTVTDANSCVSTETFIITQPTAIVASPSSTPEACSASDGTASVAPSGGTPGYTFSWAPSGGTASTATGLVAGNYTCTITDANSCVTTGSTTVASSACGPVAAFTAAETTPCVGESVLFTDLSTGTPTSWSWSFPGGSPSSSTLQNPTVFYGAAGVYDVTLTATNAFGSDIETVVGYMTVSANPTVGFTSNPTVLIVCEGTMITLNGTGAVSYNWSGGVTNGVPFAATVSDVYTVFGTDANGCIGTNNATVTVNASPTITVTRTPTNGIVCSGGQATLAGNGAVSYAWSGGITDGVAFTPPSTTTYTVTGTDGNGCTATAQSTITVQSCGTSTVPCGNIITNKNQSRSAVDVPGATQYRFRFYNNSTLALVSTVTQASRTLVFNVAPNLFYGTTYRWTVAVNTGAGFGAESSINCTVTFAVPKTTVPCNATYKRYGAYSAAPAILGANGYRFSFYDLSNNLVVQVTNATNYIYFSQVPNLMVGTTYKWTVEVQYPLSTGGNAFGTPSVMCLVNMVAPATTVQCGQSFNQTNDYSAVTAIQGVTGYRFTFYQSSVQVAQRAQTSNYIYFNQVVGIANGQTYQWTVEVQYNNGTGLVYGPASTPCNITFSSAARRADPNDNPVVDEQNFSFAMSMYPNPLGDGVNPTVVINNANQKDAVVSVMDLTGRVITTQMVYCEGDQYSVQLTDFPDLVAGMYIMQVQVGDQVQNQKFIAE